MCVCVSVEQGCVGFANVLYTLAAGALPVVHTELHFGGFGGTAVLTLLWSSPLMGSHCHYFICEVTSANASSSTNQQDACTIPWFQPKSTTIHSTNYWKQRHPGWEHVNDHWQVLREGCKRQDWPDMAMRHPVFPLLRETASGLWHRSCNVLISINCAMDPIVHRLFVVELEFQKLTYPPHCIVTFFHCPCRMLMLISEGSVSSNLSSYTWENVLRTW